MPYKTEKIAIDCPFFDRRVKLLPCQKERMVYLHKLGYSQRKLASLFQVSRRSVQFIIDPSKKVKDLANRRDRGGTMVYYKGGKEWSEAMKEHRKHKHELFKNTI